MDISMPRINGLVPLAEFSHGSPVPKSWFCPGTRTRCTRRVLKAGAVGYLTKRSAAEELIQAIRQVNQGKTFLSLRSLSSLRCSN
jgi:two-component system invasion response regulator UvrY